MLISKFNRIIRSRIVWTILGGIFALSLVVFIGPNTDSCVPSKANGAVEGILNGEPVSSADFRQARFFELRMREAAGLNEEDQELVRKRTWARIAALRAAGSMGISASDQEVLTVIQNQRAFQRNGVFDKDLYARIIFNQLHVSDPIATFEESIRQDIVLQKVYGVIQSAVWSPASEIYAKACGVTDVLTVQGVVLNRDQLTPPPTTTQEDARKLFEERPEMFRIPARRAVRYVRFPALDAEQPLPSDEEISNYYAANAEDYEAPGTNGPITIPLEQVRGGIISNLQHRAAIGKARESAVSFGVELQPDRFGKVAKTFEGLAAANGLQVHTSRLFTATDRLPEFRAGPDFAKRAFMLDPESREQGVTEVVGDTAAYVLMLHTNIETRLPEFTEVAERASRLARERRQAELFQAKCTEVQKGLQDAVSAGKTFEDAAAQLHLTVTNFPAFSLYSPGEEDKSFDKADLVKPAVMSLQKGKVSEVIPMDGDAMLVFMKERKTGSLLDAEMLRPELTARINKYRANLVFSDWQDYLLKSGALDDQALQAQKSAKEDKQ